MKVTEHIKHSKSTLFSIEILPPLKGKGIEDIFATLDPLMEFNPPFIDVTYHREDYVYKKRPGGLLEKVTVRKRPGTVGICAAIMAKYKVEAVPHLICGGFTKQETEDVLIEFNYIGVNNVLALRGDAVKSEGVFVAEPKGNNYAIDLVEQLQRMNNGLYLEEELENGSKTNFCIGVAGYPEKHFEAPNMQTDLKFLKAKVDAGADYIVTQMFFDNQKYIDFVKNCREMKINIPIIPGLKPITKKSQLKMLPRIFKIDIPEELYDAIDNCKNDEQVKKVGIEWAINQSKELMKFGVPCLHYYTMGKGDETRLIAEKVF